jgi:predicted dinucleotide-binding enzyme
MSEVEVAIVGAGNVGSALARRFVASGIETVLGVRKPEPVRAKFEALGVKVATPREAIAAARVAFLAVPGKVAIEVAHELASVLAGKILVDCNNPVGRAGGIVWDPPPEGSLAAALQARLPDSQVVKGFNGFGAEFHEDPRLGAGRVDVFLAGPDAAKAEVAQLGERAGFRTIDAGPLRNAALLENLAVLWIHLAMFGGHGRDVAFVLTRRSASS